MLAGCPSLMPPWAPAHFQIHRRNKVKFGRKERTVNTAKSETGWPMGCFILKDGVVVVGVCVQTHLESGCLLGLNPRHFVQIWGAILFRNTSGRTLTSPIQCSGYAVRSPTTTTHFSRDWSAPAAGWGRGKHLQQRRLFRSSSSSWMALRRGSPGGNIPGMKRGVPHRRSNNRATSAGVSSWGGITQEKRDTQKREKEKKLPDGNEWDKKFCWGVALSPSKTDEFLQSPRKETVCEAGTEEQWWFSVSMTHLEALCAGSCSSQNSWRELGKMQTSPLFPSCF